MGRMEAMGKLLCGGWKCNAAGIIRRELVKNSFRNRRPMSSSKILQATKQKSKVPLKKPQRVHPEYRPSNRKPPPNPYALLKERPNVLRHRIIPIVLGSITLVGISAYCTFFYISLQRTPIGPSTPTTQADVSTRYDNIANTFDSSVDWTEWMMGITKLRQKLASEASGDVLEVSIGTGRNLEFYDWDFKRFNGVGRIHRNGNGIKRGKIRSFTAVDKSAEMLEVAHEKFSELYPGVVGVRWVIQDASETIPGAPKNANEKSGNLEKKYDTVVQTMGLCSVGDPVKLLRNLGECVKEDTGRILLLEHGRGKWDWLNKVLDQTAVGHAKGFGCWWNRDLDEIVRESGLEVVKMDRWHGGTTWWIELKKPKKEDVKEGPIIAKF